MTTREEREKRDEIWQFVLEHERFFCDPPPEGLGFPGPAWSRTTTSGTRTSGPWT